MTHPNTQGTILTMSHPLLFVVVLTNNRRDDTLACLDSLQRSDYQNMKIILLENLSMADAAGEVEHNLPNVQTIRLHENLGYAGNNNIGIRAALEQGAEWILVLNDDTVLDPSCLSLLIEVAEREPRIGVLGPMVYHFDEPQIIQTAGGSLGRSWMIRHLGQDQHDRGQFDTVREVDWISGCAILVRGALVEEIGMLDADYFLYWEEVEWCVRARKKGWRICHVPQAKLWHKGVKQYSNYQPKPYVTYYVTRNHLYTLKKHKAPWRAYFVAYMRIFQTLLSWSLRPKWRAQHQHRNAMWKGLLHFFQRRLGPMQS